MRSTHRVRMGWKTAAVAGLVFLVVTGTALTVYASLVDRGSGTSPDVAAPVEETVVPEQSTSTAVPTPAATPQTGGSDDTGGVDEEPPVLTNQVVYSFAHDAFENLWGRTDVPVRETEVDRTWIWGAEPLSPGMSEAWEEAPGGERLVQYFEKGRMELDTEQDPEESWYVTSGLLAFEMIEGYYQVGPDSFDESPNPAEVPVVGDADTAGVPSYSEINELGLTDAEPNRELGDLITEEIIDGTIQSDDRLGAYEVTTAHYAPPTEHAIASVFWDFMNSQDTIYQDGEYSTDALFANPFHLIGYPVTEAYWATVQIGSDEMDVLWQCFERRCLTYTPDNEPGFQIESGDAGLHYYEWRYGQ